MVGNPSKRSILALLRGTGRSATRVQVREFGSSISAEATAGLRAHQPLHPPATCAKPQKGFLLKSLRSGSCRHDPSCAHQDLDSTAWQGHQGASWSVPDGRHLGQVLPVATVIHPCIIETSAGHIHAAVAVGVVRIGERVVTAVASSYHDVSFVDATTVRLMKRGVGWTLSLQYTGEGDHSSPQPILTHLIRSLLPPFFSPSRTRSSCTRSSCTPSSSTLN